MRSIGNHSASRFWGQKLTGQIEMILPTSVPNFFIVLLGLRFTASHTVPATIWMHHPALALDADKNRHYPHF